MWRIETGEIPYGDGVVPVLRIETPPNGAGAVSTPPNGDETDVEAWRDLLPDDAATGTDWGAS